MKTQERPNGPEGFQVEDPLAVFTAFSQEELRRWRDTEAHCDSDLHQEAVVLVVTRLKKRLSTVAH